MRTDAPFCESWSFAFVGIPFKDRGTGWDGCDCYGLARLILKTRLGIHLPLYPEIATVNDPAMFRTFVRESASESWMEIPAGQEQPYDLVLMRGIVGEEGRRASRPVHVGLVIQPGRMIHIEKGSGASVVDYRKHPSVKHRVISFFRWCGGDGKPEAVAARPQLEPAG